MDQRTGDMRGGRVIGSRGSLLLRQASPDAAQAEACFHQALDLARRQQAKSLELRAAMSLSRLWQRQGKRPKPTRCSPRSTAGSPRGLTRPTSRTPRPYWRNSGANTNRHHPPLPPLTPQRLKQGATARGGQPQHAACRSTDRGAGVLRGGMDYGTQYPWHNRPYRLE